jgi:hypothetical protein
VRLNPNGATAAPIGAKGNPAALKGAWAEGVAVTTTSGKGLGAAIGGGGLTLGGGLLADSTAPPAGIPIGALGSSPGAKGPNPPACVEEMLSTQSGR